MTDLKPGQRVSVTFTGTVRTPGTGHLWIENDGGPSNLIPNGQITPLDPANWPPQVGDIWELDGYEYAAKQARRGRPGKIFVVSVDDREDGFYLTDSRADEFKNSSPTLLRRRGE